jgi:hypothetical protein
MLKYTEQGLNNSMCFEMLQKWDSLFIYNVFTNSKGQTISLVEHPTKGDSVPIIAVCEELKIAATTDFYETGEMLASHGEYEPWFNDKGELVIGD